MMTQLFGRLCRRSLVGDPNEHGQFPVPESVEQLRHHLPGVIPAGLPSVFNISGMVSNRSPGVLESNDGTIIWDEGQVAVVLLSQRLQCRRARDSGNAPAVARTELGCECLNQTCSFLGNDFSHASIVATDAARGGGRGRRGDLESPFPLVRHARWRYISRQL